MKTLNESDPQIRKLKQALIDLESYKDNVFIPAMSNATQRDQGKLLSLMKKEREKVDRIKSEMTMVEYFDKLTLPYVFQGRSFVTALMLFGVIEHPDPIEFKNNTGLFHGFSGQPIESLASLADFGTLLDARKCFTFFSSLQKQWREFKMNLNNFFITNVYSEKKSLLACNTFAKHLTHVNHDQRFHCNQS